MPLSLLLVEEDSSQRERWTEALRSAGHRVFSFGDPRAGLEVARTTPFDLAVISFADPEMSHALQAVLKEKNPACQITLLTERPKDEKGAQVLESGARSVLLRPIPGGTIERMVEQVSRARTKTRPARVGAADEILGRSASIHRVREMIRKVSTSDTSVLITGESGTGKELVARAIHGTSPRSGEAFLELNCAAIPDHLLESELFGHEKGAFTDAGNAKPGLFELADRGSLFLDEIGEMNLELQAKLLRVIDTKSVRRLSGQDLRKLDVRIIAATNRDLAMEVQSRSFRGDLFHRLNVVQIELPPLRDRVEDVRLLAEHFLSRYARKFSKAVRYSEDVLRAMEVFPWPGNVRELINQIERAVLLTHNQILDLTDFPLLSEGEVRRGPQAVIHIGEVRVDFSEGPVPLEAIEREVLQQALDATSWNISEAARLLGIGRGALRYKIDRLGIEKRALAG